MTHHAPDTAEPAPSPPVPGRAAHAQPRATRRPTRLWPWILTLVTALSTMVSGVIPSVSMAWPGSQSMCAEVAVTVAVNPDQTVTHHLLDYRITAGHSHGPPAPIDGSALRWHTYYVLAGKTPVLVHNNDPCKTAVLGVQQYSDALASQLRASNPGGVFETYNIDRFARVPAGDFRPPWMHRVSDAVARGSGYRIAFALDDLRGRDPLDMFTQAVQEGGRLDARGLPRECATCWELRQVFKAVQNGDLSPNAVTFYLGGQRLDDFNPFD